MKKFLLIIFTVLFTCLNAEAVQQVFFNNTGAPIRTNYGYGRYRTPYNYGYNAPYRYRRMPAHPRYYPNYRYPALARSAYRYFNPYRMGYYNPYYGYGMPYARKRYSVVNPTITRREPMSTLDKSYIVPSNYHKRVTCGGVTYYGAMNPCK